jgi:hypothetical protein
LISIHCRPISVEPLFNVLGKHNKQTRKQTNKQTKNQPKKQTIKQTATYLNSQTVTRHQLNKQNDKKDKGWWTVISHKLVYYYRDSLKGDNNLSHKRYSP